MNLDKLPWEIALQYPPSQHSAQPSLQPSLYPATIDPNLLTFGAGGQVQFSQTASSFGEGSIILTPSQLNLKSIILPLDVAIHHPQSMFSSNFIANSRLDTPAKYVFK